MLAEGWLPVPPCDDFFINVSAILQMRLYALFSLDKRVLALMLTCFVMSTSTSAYVLNSVLSKITGMFIGPKVNAVVLIQGSFSNPSTNRRNVLRSIAGFFKFLFILDTDPLI